MRYRILRQIPTDRGRTVHVAETDDRLVVVKTATNRDQAAELRAQGQHLRVMRGLLDDDALYPPVLWQDTHRLVLPYIPGGALTDAATPGVAGWAARDAVHHLFRIACLTPTLPDATQQHRAAAAGEFLAGQAETRATRLAAALATPVGARWAADNLGGQTRGDALLDSLWWAHDAGWLARAAPGRLALSAHGDLTPGNILPAGGPDTAGVVFIDTRGVWIGGLPWWDPVMDLASLVTFGCRVAPAMAAAGLDEHAAPLCESEILAGVATDPACRRWLDSDPCWPVRLHVATAIRLLGNIANQLLTAPRNGGRRAAVVADLYLHHVARLAELHTAAAPPSVR